MKINLPKKSLLGFKILGYKASTNFAYLILLFCLIVFPKFGTEKIEYIAGNFFLIISNSSILILLINSILRISKNDLLYRVLNFFLLVYLPFSILIILNSLMRLLFI